MADDIKHHEHEPFDVFTDAFTVTLTPFGANLSFAVREAHPAPGRPPQLENLGTLRMSVEHLKTMLIIIRRQILKVEEDWGIKTDVPREILRQMQIAPEDWESFWKLGGDLK